MKIALLADIHGNDLALEAVLNDIEMRGGADAYWVLGDLVAIGHAPITVLEMLQKLSKVRIIRGNTERYVFAAERPSPTFADVRADLTLMPQLVEVAADFAWTQGALTVSGWLESLSDLPLDYRETLPDGTTVLCVHAAPNNDDGPGIKQEMDPQEIKERVAGSQADLICVGHTHRPFNIHIGGQHIVNPGSVSNPVGPDVRACYAMISAAESGYEVDHFRVDYDQQAVIDTLYRINHPGRNFISKHLRGEIQ